jgi:hypothetical protein
MLNEMPDWAKKRLEELEAAAPVKRKKTEPPFVRVPLWWAAAAAKATKAPELLVCTDLLYRAWKAKGQSFTMPSGWLEKKGASRKAKCRVLRNLAAAGLIVVEWRDRKSPRITLVAL